MDRDRRGIAAVAFVVTVAVSLWAAESPVPATVLMVLAYAVWLAIVAILGDRSRLVGGLALLLLSGLLLAVGAIATWVGPFGLAVLAHGSWLAITGAARLDD